MMVYEMSGTDLVTNYILLRYILYNKRLNTPTNYGLLSDSGNVDVILNANQNYIMMMSSRFMIEMKRVKTKPNTTTHVVKTLCELMTGAFWYCMANSEVFNERSSSFGIFPAICKESYFKMDGFTGLLPRLEDRTISNNNLSKDDKDAMLIRKCKYIVVMAVAEIVRLYGVNSLSVRYKKKTARNSKNEGSSTSDSQESGADTNSTIATERSQTKKRDPGFDDEMYVKHRLNKTDQFCGYLSAIYNGDKRTFVDEKVAKLLAKVGEPLRDDSSMRAIERSKFFYKPRNVCYWCLHNKLYDVSEVWRARSLYIAQKVCSRCIGFGGFGVPPCREGHNRSVEIISPFSSSNEPPTTVESGNEDPKTVFPSCDDVLFVGGTIPSISEPETEPGKKSDDTDTEIIPTNDRLVTEARLSVDESLSLLKRQASKLSSPPKRSKK